MRVAEAETNIQGTHGMSTVPVVVAASNGDLAHPGLDVFVDVALIVKGPGAALTIALDLLTEVATFLVEQLSHNGSSKGGDDGRETMTEYFEHIESFRIVEVL